MLHTTSDMASTVIGTPFYMSPELCEDQPYNQKVRGWQRGQRALSLTQHNLRPQSDVWALGCILYEMCTLRRAFEGTNMCALVLKILNGKYPPVPDRYTAEMHALVDVMLQQKARALRGQAWGARGGAGRWSWGWG